MIASRMFYSAILSHVRQTNWKRLAIIISDLIVVPTAYMLAFYIRLGDSFFYKEVFIFFQSLPLVIAIRFATFKLYGLYRGAWQYASVPDMMNIAKAVTTGSLAMVASTFFLRISGFPRSVFIIDWLIVLFAIGASRFCIRLRKEMWRPGRSSRRALIIGGGDAGEMLVREMQRDVSSQFTPVGFLDDRKEKHGLRIRGVPVLGPCDKVVEFARKKRAEAIIITAPSATGPQMRRLVANCQNTKLPIKTVPSLCDFLGGNVSVSNLREVRVEDLVNRDPVRCDKKLIWRQINDRVIMVTGAGGSIGSELCKQIVNYRPSHLVMFDISENGLFYLDDMLSHMENAPPVTSIVGNIQDEMVVDETVHRFQPDIIFHAAAHKHVPLLEFNPEVAVKNNVWGTATVAWAAERHRVKKFVNISTDKAVSPTSVMGATKRVAETFIGCLSQNSITKFSTVRFGNVLGSEGSVVRLFQRQIERGGPVTVTHREIKRFFMTISEAVELVIQAAAMGVGGEVFVLEMGEQLPVIDLARHLIYLSGLEPERDIEIRITGLRPGEKMYEELWEKDEKPMPTSHRKIFVSSRTMPDPESFLAEMKLLISYANAMKRDLMLRKLLQLVPTFRTTWLKDLVPTEEMTPIGDEVLIKKLEEEAEVTGASSSTQLSH